MHLSIIIPHKNSFSTLQRCLNSIPIIEGLEVIIVDDNSSDIDEDSFPGKERSDTKILFSKHDLTAGGCRNLGLKYAKGDWIMFADSDDFFSYSLSDIISDYINSTFDIVYFRVKSVYSENIKKVADRANKIDNFFELLKKDKSTAEKFFRYGFTEPWAKLIRHRLIKKHNIMFDEVKVSNDYWFSVLTGFHAKSIFVDNRVLYVVTKSETSLSISYQDLERLKIRTEISAKVVLFFKENKVDFQEPYLKMWLWQLLTSYPKFFFIYFLNLIKLDIIFLNFFFFSLRYGLNNIGKRFN